MVSKMLAEDTRKANCEAPVAREDGPKGDTIYMMTALPRKTPKLLALPQPMECRPEGTRPPLVLNLVSDGVPRGVDIAMGRVPRRNAAAVVTAIRSAAGNRSIHLNIDDAGGNGVHDARCGLSP